MIIADRMHLDPVLRAGVAGFAADAVGELELRPAPRRRHVVGVAVEADVRRVRRLQPELASDLLGLLVEQHGVGVGVWVARLPGGVLVLQHDAALRRGDRAVAGGARAGRHAEMHGVAMLRHGRQVLGQTRRRRGEGAPHERDDQMQSGINGHLQLASLDPPAGGPVWKRSGAPLRV
jgi:hypothetical protein